MPPAAEVEAPDIIELRQPIVEAAEQDGRADVALLQMEAAAAAEGDRRGALLLEAAILVEAGQAEGGAEAALTLARAAFEADPAQPVALWALRRLLGRAERWDELAEVFAAAAAEVGERAPGGSPERTSQALEDRAELLVERGRVLEDRLGRDDDAVAAYRDALAAVPDQVGALLALLLSGARRGDALAMATALEGLARRAGESSAEGTRRAALAIEAARAWRQHPDPSGPARALAALEVELDRGGPSAPVGMLLSELDTFTRADTPQDVAVRALEILARRIGPLDRNLGVALWRERARLLARAGAAQAALESLDEAARLDPAHPLVAAARLEQGEAAGRGEMVDALARELIEAARTDDDAVDIALLHAGMALRAGREAAADASLGAPRVHGRRAARADLRAFELALTIRRHDQAGLANALLGEAGLLSQDRGENVVAGANALTAAGSVWQWSLNDPRLAEEMYRRALAVAPAHPAALRALVAVLGGDRAAEAVPLLEGALDAGATGAVESWVREMLVTIHADELAQPALALAHQRRLVALAPDDVARRVRLHDLELGGTLGVGGLEVETLLALAERAGDAAVAIALRVEAARGLAASADRAAAARGLALLEELSTVDPSGLASSASERAAATPDARAEVIRRELVAIVGSAPAETVRALRFRLAHHHVAAGRYAEGLAALTPLRSEGDPVARAWSYELARRSGEAILEVAVLSEEIEAPDPVLGSEAGLLLAHGEALARVGDPDGAAGVLRRALAAAPTGPTAAEAALALYRIAAAERRPSPDALSEAARALANACADEPGFAEQARREEALQRVVAGAADPADLELSAGDGAPARARAEAALVRFVTGARLRDGAAVAEALVELALIAGGDGAPGDTLVPLLSRALARARFAGGSCADTIARRIWQATHHPGLAPAISDLPVPGGGGWPAERPDTRRSRARRTGGSVGLALELDVALDAERRGALGTALSAYGSVIAIDPDRLEAWTGIRRVARAGGDPLGEGRALARMAALVRDPDRAAALLEEAAAAYEQAGRRDDALTSLAKVVELRPGEDDPYDRLHALLLEDLGSMARVEMFDNLLSHRLGSAELSSPARAELLYERSSHRLTHGARDEAFTDLKQILNIYPEHVEALYQLAGGAIEDDDARSAAHWLERFLAAAGDDPRAVDARLDLAAAFEASMNRARAVETLRRAAMLRPADPIPLHRLADLHLREGDWRSAIEAMRAAEPRLAQPTEKAALHLRIGAVLRDMARDPAAASGSFQRAAELDPLGDGMRALVALHDAAQQTGGALQTVEHELASIRRALAVNPLDAALLERLKEFLGMARARGASAALAEAEVAATSVIELGRDRVASAAPRPFAPRSGRELWSELLDPAAGGFISEVWPNLSEAAAEIHPAPAPREKRVPVVVTPADPVWGWIAAAAAALGIEELQLATTRDPRALPVSAVEDPRPVLVVAPGAERTPGFRFHVGRALGLLVQRATVLERTRPEELAPLFACAAVLSGAATPPGLAAPSEEALRAVSRAIGRRQRKALALQASRFPFETFDVASWHAAALRTADRLGLLMAGDVAAAALARSGAEGPAGASAAVAASSPALEILRYALGDRYPVVRWAASSGSSGTASGGAR